MDSLFLSLSNDCGAIDFPIDEVIITIPFVAFIVVIRFPAVRVLFDSVSIAVVSFKFGRVCASPRDIVRDEISSVYESCFPERQMWFVSAPGAVLSIRVLESAN